MSEVFNQILIQTGYGVTVLLVSFFLYNFFSKGFLLTYLKVKASRGKKILIRVLSLTGFYYRAGVIDNSILSFKNKVKEKDSYKLEKGDIGQEMGVNVVNVDETIMKVIKVNGDTREGKDTLHFDSHLKRALYKPSLKDNPREMLMLGIVIISALASLFTLYLVYAMSQTISQGGASGVI